MKQVDINLDYIMHLIDQMKDKNDEDREKKIQDLRRLIDSSLNLRSKKDLIEEFIAQINPQSDIDNEFSTFIEKKMKEELNTIIDDLNLNAEQSYIFINKSFDV
ncbi:type I site-specific deoxyribonuclease, HsdR family protein [Helicobacter muridarum]|nr:type I site-specific deoxyribonuclease, HsdR family protein [Helicobacter muridarum]